MRILQLSAERFKRLSIIDITPEGNIVQITGQNGNGKTSVLDAIYAVAAGAEGAQEVPIQRGAKRSAITMRLGGDEDGRELTIERVFTEKDAGGYLSVKSSDGARYPSPQKMLDALMGRLTFDPLAFMRQSAKDQLETLRGIVPVDIDLGAVDREIAMHYAERGNVNRDAARAKATAESITVPADLPENPPDIGEITDRLTGADAHNAAIRARVAERDRLADVAGQMREEISRLEQRLAEVRGLLGSAETAVKQINGENRDVEMIDTAAVRAELDAANVVRDAIRRRQDKMVADGESKAFAKRAEELTAQMDELKTKKSDAIAKAPMPVPGLAFGDGNVTFNGLPLSQASDAEQLLISTAIAAALNPKLRVVRIRDGSLLDSKSLAALADFATKNDLQVWIEQVTEGGDVGIVMEDGHIRGQEALVEAQKEAEAAPAVEDGEAEEASRKAALEFITAKVAELANVKTAADANTMNALVKKKCSRFETLVKEKWVPEYLARVQRLTKKR